MRILVVDDDAGMREMLAAMLSGDTVEQAANGAEALEKVGTFDPQLLLTDGRMPEMSGPTLVSALQGRVPVVAVTGDSVCMRQFEQLGVEVVVKPFEVPRLLAAIDRALGVAVWHA